MEALHARDDVPALRVALIVLQLLGQGHNPMRVPTIEAHMLMVMVRPPADPALVPRLSAADTPGVLLVQIALGEPMSALAAELAQIIRLLDDDVSLIDTFEELAEVPQICRPTGAR